MPTPRLWTPIANALEAYRRRVVMNPEAEYEHIWRLIHIQEALAVTLASLMATRLAHLVAGGGDEISVLQQALTELREALTGLRQESAGSDDDDDVEPSPWGGSIGAWIELLRRFGKVAVRPDDRFLTALSLYLSSTPNRPLAFADAWTRIAPVPSTFRDPALDRVGRLGAINSFRNKLAHVPVQQRLLGDLHRGLRVEVLDGLTDKFNPETDATSPGFIATSYRDPLVGILYVGNTYVTGGSEVGIDASRDHDKPTLEASYRCGATAVDWLVAPFFRIDGEAKAALLFRVPDLQREPGGTGYGGEYHRFAAELEPVNYVTIPAEVIAPWIPRFSAPALGAALAVPEEQAKVDEHAVVPSIHGKSFTTEESAAEPKPSPAELRRMAEEAFFRRDYGSAIALFDTLAKSGDLVQYNDVARLKHGAALWRAAERSSSDHDLHRSFEKAVSLLRAAERHRDPRYAARSAYEGSKALWHLWRSTNDSKHLLSALAAAERAVAHSPYEAFISWQARVKNDVDVAFPQGIPQLPAIPEDPLQTAFDRRADELYGLSVAHRKSGRYPEGAAAAEEAIRLCATHVGAWHSLATNLDQLGRPEQARAAWRAFDGLAAQSPIDYESAAYNALLDVRTNATAAGAWERLAKAYDREGRGAEAIAEAQSALLSRPEIHASLIPLVELLMNQLPGEVGELVANMRTIAGNYPPYIHLAGVAQRKARHNHLAVDTLQLACDLEPLNGNYWYALGRCREDMGDFAAALDAFNKAVDCNPPHRKARERLHVLATDGKHIDLMLDKSGMPADEGSSPTQQPAA